MRTDLFDFELPPERIALRPVVPRDAARLLVVRPGSAGELEDRAVRELPDLLQPGDALVVNDSKVVAARLQGRRIGRGAAEPAIEATLHRRVDGARWRAFVKPAKRLSPGDVVRFGVEGRVCFLGQLDATVEEIVATEMPEPPKLVDLMEALRKSLNAVSTEKTKPVKAAIKKAKVKATANGARKRKAG